MTIELPTYIATFLLAAALGAAVCLVIMRRLTRATFAARSALAEENARLRQQLTRAETLAVSVRTQLEDTLVRSNALAASSQPPPARKKLSPPPKPSMALVPVPHKLATALTLAAPPKRWGSLESIASEGPAPVDSWTDERVDGANVPRASGIQELRPRRAVVTMPNIDEIADLARRLWHAAGEPEGREGEFWFRAEAQLISQGVARRAAADQSANDNVGSAAG